MNEQNLAGPFGGRVAELGAGVVCRGKLPVAKIIRSGPGRVSRPKVGKATSERFQIPDDAFAQLGAEDLNHWGL